MRQTKKRFRMAAEGPQGTGGVVPLAVALAGEAQAGSARDLAHRLRQAIQSRSLAAGARLPPTRHLAAQLNLGRNTVASAYSMLQAEGWLEGQGRLGTFVAQGQDERSVGVAPGLPFSLARGRAPQVARRLGATGSRQIPPHADWRLSQTSILTMSLDVWRKACREVGRTLPPCDHGDPRGDSDLRQGIGRWLEQQRGLTVNPDQIIVTQGASQGLALLAELLVRSGDLCALENPGYQRAARLFAQQGAELLRVPVDAQGAQVEAAFARARPPLLFHLTPAHHYPLGVRLPGPRRVELVRLARRYGTLVLENEYDHEFMRVGVHHAPLMAVAPTQTVLIGTFARAISPALRLGFLVAPRPIADRLAQAVAEDQRQTDWPVQRAVAWLLRSGELDRHLRRVRRRSAALFERVLERAQTWAPGLTLAGGAGGQHVVLSLANARSSAEFHRQLTASGVMAYSLDRFSVGASAWHGSVFSFAHMDEPQLEKALAILDRCAQTCLSGTRGGRAAGAVRPSST